MGIACSMSNILQTGCAVVTPTPGSSLCVTVHPDSLHPMTWIVHDPPANWVGPWTIDWDDGNIEVGTDGEDAHEYRIGGTYVIEFSDAAGHSCSVTISVPHT